MIMNDKLIIIPTYDECENVRPIAKAVFDIYPQTDILFIDDNSSDGTGRIIDEMCTADSRINAIHHQHKGGLGKAYIAGFKWALVHEYKLIFEMDADFSHDPREIPNFIKTSEDADLVLGSRYMNGIRITNWPLRRLALSKGAANYVKIITGMPVTDPTGGYKCYRREVLQAIDLDSIISNGYSFQVEMTHTAWMKGFRIKEIPIIFEDRRSGYSKMNYKIAREAIWLVWKLAFRQKFKRTPTKQDVANR